MWACRVEDKRQDITAAVNEISKFESVMLAIIFLPYRKQCPSR